MKRTIGTIAIVAALLVPARALAQAWTFTGNLNTPRGAPAIFVLPDGKVLAAGDINDGFVGTTTTTAELYDPLTQTWTYTGSTTSFFPSATAVRLQDGRILITGGRYGSTYSTSLNNAEIYDPATGTWTVTGRMNTGRVLHTATLLPNGTVLVTGGYNHTGGGFLASAEIYHPSSGTWSYANPMPVGAWQQSATLLPNGKVLVAGGENYAYCSTGCRLPFVYLYDPATNTWTWTGSLNTPTCAHRATLLSNGKVLIVGGVENSGYSRTAELYDVARGTWSKTGTLNHARMLHTLTVLPDGGIIVAGGYALTGALSSVERYDITYGIWTDIAPLNQSRSNHGAVLLDDGRVLVAGGWNGSRVRSAELYMMSDAAAPMLTLPADITAEATSASGATLAFSASAYDGIDGARPVTCEPSSGSTFALGKTTVTCSASDLEGNTATGSFTVTVRDTTAPAIGDVRPSTWSLWAPNHRMVPIAISVSVRDNTDSSPVCSIASVSSNEAGDGAGDGHTARDWEVTGPLTVNLRAERAGTGNGRVYTIAVRCADRFGNASFGSAGVSVPHDRR